MITEHRNEAISKLVAYLSMFTVYVNNSFRLILCKNPVNAGTPPHIRLGESLQ